jgi:biopolymer transport protein ExbD
VGKEKQFIDHRRQRLMRVSWGLILLIIAILAIACVSFYMFTATLSSPTQMTLYLPKQSGKDSVDKYRDVKKKLTLILLKDDKVFGYYGDFIKGGRAVAVDETDKLIADGWKMFSKDSLVVVIKPSKEASYKSTIDILDQMTINQIEKYSMNDPDKQEKEFLKIDE